MPITLPVPLTEQLRDLARSMNAAQALSAVRDQYQAPFTILARFYGSPEQQNI